jgi:hypothetical protein
LTPKEQHPSLYHIARKKRQFYVAHAFIYTPINLSFGRALVGDKFIKWNELFAKVALVQLDDQHDSIKWSLRASARVPNKLLVKSMITSNS